LGPIVVEWNAVWLTLQLAGISTGVLFVLGTPLAWWLAHTTWRGKVVVEAVTAMPLVLPPTVLGFYLLILLSPDAPFGSFWLSMTGESLTFNFTGLVLASVVYSLPFMVQPLQSAFSSLDRAQLEAAASLGATRLDTFFTVALPLCRRGFLTAAVLTFAHTLGEFGVVLMVGGNIPGETRVLSIAIYEHVETLNYAQAHVLAAGMLAFSFVILLLLYETNKPYPVSVGDAGR